MTVAGVDAPPPGTAPGRRLLPVRAVLPDGTPSYAPIGVVVRDGERVLCHLCGDWFRSVVAHLRAHGWDHLAYRAAFGLERGEPLEGSTTRHRRASSMRERRRHEPAVRAGCEVGRQLARSGALTRAAAAAARGRRQPEQRRQKTLRTLAVISPEVRAAGSKRHAEQRLRQTAAEAATRLGHPDLGAAVRARFATGESLAGISRAAGLHKDWLSRHLSTVDPAAAAFVGAGHEVAKRTRQDARWQPALDRLGHPDVAGYLTDRHLTRHWTVQAIAVEVKMSRAAVEAALTRHGLDRVPHAAARSRCQDRADAVAARFGHPDLDTYFAARRAAGLSWRAIATECGQPPTWIRRRANLTH